MFTLGLFVVLWVLGVVGCGLGSFCLCKFECGCISCAVCFV